MRKILFSLLMIMGLAASAADKPVAPDVLIRNASGDALNVLNKEHVAPTDKRFQDMLDAKVLPNFDFTRITAYALGRHWSSATPEQQATVVREFRTLLVRTYSTALTSAKLKAIDVKPAKLADADTDTIVNSVVEPIDGKPIKIDYRMKLTGDGWKVYDIQVEGVSLVTNYRTAFNDTVQHGGIDALIKELQARNAAPVKS